MIIERIEGKMSHQYTIELHLKRSKKSKIKDATLHLKHDVIKSRMPQFLLFILVTLDVHTEVRFLNAEFDLDSFSILTGS
jgi:hypothetical protein